jgi:hypothetical protein
MLPYLFQIELPEITDEVDAAISDQREYINKLFTEGRILSYSVSLQRDHIWCVVAAESEKEAMDLISAFPLRKFFADVSYHQLLFHNTMPAALPEISLN